MASSPTTIALLFALARGTSGPEWSRFRGPDGAGHAPSGARLPGVLDPAKNLRWSTPLPSGHSSPCLTAERVFVTGCEEDELRTVCIARADGKLLWTRAIKAPASPPGSSGSTAFPIPSSSIMPAAT